VTNFRQAYMFRPRGPSPLRLFQTNFRCGRLWSFGRTPQCLELNPRQAQLVSRPPQDRHSVLGMPERMAARSRRRGCFGGRSRGDL